MTERPFHSAWIAGDGPVHVAGAAEAPFPWWSFTKTLIAVCALRLAEDGVVDLDAMLPGRPYSLRQLLQHRAGVPNYGALRAYHDAVARGEEPWPRDRLVAAVDADTLDFPPGEGWAYSNVGYLFAREAVERAAGRDLGSILDACVFRPAGARSARLATSRADFRDVLWPAARGYHPGWVYHGCVVGTAVDAVRVVHALAHRRLLGPDAMAALHRRHDLGGALPGRPWTACGYGLGLMTGRMGPAGRAFGHSGGGPFCVNAVYHFPELAPGVSVATFTDGTEEGPAEAEAARIALECGVPS